MNNALGYEENIRDTSTLASRDYQHQEYETTFRGSSPKLSPLTFEWLIQHCPRVHRVSLPRAMVPFRGVLNHRRNPTFLPA